MSFKPYLNWGGGGQFDPPPPVRNPATAADREDAFSWVFSFKSYASFDTKFAKIGPSVARSHDVVLCLCTKHMEMTDFLKCTKNSVYFVFLAICTSSYILNLIKIKLQKIKNHKNNEIHKK